MIHNIKAGKRLPKYAQARSGRTVQALSRAWYLAGQRLGYDEGWRDAKTDMLEQEQRELSAMGADIFKGY